MGSDYWLFVGHMIRSFPILWHSVWQPQRHLYTTERFPLSFPIIVHTGGFNPCILESDGIGVVISDLIDLTHSNQDSLAIHKSVGKDPLVVTRNHLCGPISRL